MGRTKFTTPGTHELLSHYQLEARFCLIFEVGTLELSLELAGINVVIVLDKVWHADIRHVILGPDQKSEDMRSHGSDS